MEPVSGEFAITCANVTKEFYSLEELSLWRLVLRGEPSGVGYRALSNVSIDVPKGEFVGLLGLNGAGKSTLLRTISGSYSPTSGVIDVDGAISGLYELGVSGNEHLTGREYAERWLSIQGVSGLQRREIIGSICEFSELGEYFDQPIRTYSAGMKVRLYFSVATATPEKVFLIDEALTVGDEHFVAKCWRRMRNLLTEGAAGLFATHDWGAVLKLCRKAYVLDKGEIIDHGMAQAVVQRYLGLEAPVASLARIDLEEKAVFFADCGKNACFEIPVVVLQHRAVFISASIEVFHRGFGWQHMLHLSGQKVGDKAGHYVIKITIPDLPLAPGEYSLNLFLTSSAEGGEIFDCRSWTYNNGLKLIVSGVHREGLAVLPVQVC